jgi:hypothetical protein
MDGSIASYTKFCEMNKMDVVIAKHNDPANDFHLEVHDLMVLGNEIHPASGEVTLIVSSIWMLLNYFRVIICGWPVRLHADVTFNFCKEAVRLLGYGFTTMGGVLLPSCYCFIPSGGESFDMYVKNYEAFQKDLRYLVKNFKYCALHVCPSCTVFRGIMHHITVQDHLEDTLWTQDKRLMIQFAVSDNCAGFQKFAREHLMIPIERILVCIAHLTGCSFTSLSHACLAASDYAVYATGIPAKGTKHSQYFRSRSNYEKFIQYCLRNSKCPQIKVARLAQEALVAWFDTLDGEGGAKTWFRDNWLGARGFWTSADAGFAGSWNP